MLHISKDVEYYYQLLKSEQPIKRAIRGLPHELTSAEIETFLKAELNNNDVSVSQLTKRDRSGTKVPMPLFLVRLPSVECKVELDRVNFIHRIKVYYEDYVYSVA